ncbi:unnamed protein product, partial [Schistocephalus solidus]|uniref:PHM7_ext domain-containing protein n=1 Tax=Schistocephalus solidus TaxID=70667 RepID=A0A183TAY9_SCHSO
TRRLIFAERHAEFDRTLDGPNLTIVSAEEKEVHNEEDETERLPIPWWKHIINWFCGTESMQNTKEPVFTQEEAEEVIELTRKQLSIRQDPTEALFVDVGMAVVLGITVFASGFLS